MIFTHQEGSGVVIGGKCRVSFSGMFKETAETGRVQEMTRYESCLCSSLIESLSDVGAGRPE